MVMLVSRWLLAAALLLSISAVDAAAPGDEIDFFPDFIEMPGGMRERASAVAVQADGRILLAGAIEVGDRTQVAIARMLPDGTPDPGFGTGGQRQVTFGTETDSAAGWIGELPDGRILVLGTVYDPAGFSVSLLVMRLLPSGEFDNSFSVDGRARYGTDVGAYCGLAISGSALGSSCDAQVLPDGSVMIAGGSAPPASLAKRLAFGGGVLLYKLRPDTTPDPAFGDDGHLYLRTLPGAPVDGPRLVAFRAGLAVRDDGRILVATGIETSSSGAFGIALLQLRANGTPDAGFGSGGGTSVTPDAGDAFLPFDVHVARNGEITVGATASLNGLPAFAVARFRSNGTPDPGFGSNGLAAATLEPGDEFEASPMATGLHVDSTGHVYVTGSTGTSTIDGQDNVDFALAAFTPQGLADTRVGPGGLRAYGFDISAGGGPFYVLREYALSLASDAQGRLVVAGGAIGPDPYDALLVRRILTRDMFRDGLE